MAKDKPTKKNDKTKPLLTKKEKKAAKNAKKENKDGINLANK